VKNTCEKTANCVKTNKGKSSWFETRSGVRQGSVLSPILFNVMMNKICTKVSEEMKETDLKAFIYASDVMIWGEDVKELGTILIHWERARNTDCREDSNVKSFKKWRKKHGSENKWKRDKRSR
jgi:hypothetical protein